jgi:hypothetical protein
MPFVYQETHQCSIEIDACHPLERELALPDISLVLEWIKVYFHEP